MNSKTAESSVTAVADAPLPTLGDLLVRVEN